MRPRYRRWTIRWTGIKNWQPRTPNWEVVGQYVDEGITGTQATKRPSFMQMIEDAQSGKFDLIVTREVCRFARNTMDTLFYTRKLSKLGVEVYFAADSIWTMDNEGELRLTIMATMAQEESRKTSERVRAGIQMSREKGVLFGNGNILGYDLDKAHNTYVINEEQAETVRMIFEQYATGDGLGKVAKALIAKGRKDGGGRLKWDSSKITRILRNPTYMGYCVYNRTQTTDLLEHSRKKNNDEETYILKKGNFTPIIDEELWHRCNEIRRSRQRNLLDENGKPRKYGGTVAKNVWVTKLVCHCGSKLRRYLWNTKRDGTQVYGFECYRHKKQSALYLKKHGLPEGICELKAFPEWKLELMARKIFETVWGNRREAVLEACRMLNACYLPGGKYRPGQAESSGQAHGRPEPAAGQPDHDEGVQPDHSQPVRGAEQRDRRSAAAGQQGEGGTAGQAGGPQDAGHGCYRGQPLRSGGFHRRYGERVVHPELCPPHHTHRRYAVRLGAGSGARTPDAGLRGQRAEGISAYYTGKQFIPGGLAAPRGFPPDLSDQQEWSAEWGHFGGGIGTGQAAIKAPRAMEK